MIKKVNDDKNINFKIEDIQKKVNEGYAKKLSEIIAKEYSLEGIAKDLDLDLNSEASMKIAKQAKADMQNKDLDELLVQIQEEQLQESMLKQGAMLNLGDKDTAEVADERIAGETELSLEKLKELIVKYRANDDVKNHQDVKDEIQKFGYIEEKNRKYHKDGSITSDISIKPSMNSYDLALDEQFMDSDKVKNLLEETVENGSGPSLGKFTKWAKSRFTKNQPSVKNIAGEEIVTPVNRTARNLVEMVKENKWFEDKIVRLKTLLETHEVGEDKLPEAKKKEIETELATAEQDMKNAEIQIQKHKTNIEKFISNTLGLDGFDWNNKDHVSAATGIATNLDLDSAGNEIFGKQFVDIMSAEKYNTLEKTYGSKQARFIQAGMKQNSKFKDYRKLIGKDNTGSDQTAQEKTVTEPELKTDEEKKQPTQQDIEADKVINAQNYINEMSSKLDSYKKVSTNDVQGFMNNIEKVLTEVKNVDKTIVGENFVKVAGKLLESINKDKNELKETAKKYHESVSENKNLISKMKSLIQSIVRKVKGLLGLGKRTIKNVEQKRVLLKSMKDVVELIRAGSDQDKILSGISEANKVQALLNGMFTYFEQDGVKLDRRMLNKMNMTEDQLAKVGETYDKYHKSLTKFKRSKYGPYVDGRVHPKKKAKAKTKTEDVKTKKESKTKDTKTTNPEPEVKTNKSTFNKEDQKDLAGFGYDVNEAVNDIENIETKEQMLENAFKSIEIDDKKANETNDEGC